MSTTSRSCSTASSPSTTDTRRRRKQTDQGTPGLAGHHTQPERTKGPGHILVRVLTPDITFITLAGPPDGQGDVHLPRVKTAPRPGKHSARGRARSQVLRPPRKVHEATAVTPKRSPTREFSAQPADLKREPDELTDDQPGTPGRKGKQADPGTSLRNPLLLDHTPPRDCNGGLGPHPPTLHEHVRGLRRHPGGIPRFKSG